MLIVSMSARGKNVRSVRLAHVEAVSVTPASLEQSPRLEGFPVLLLLHSIQS